MGSARDESLLSMEGAGEAAALVELRNSFEDASVAMALRAADGQVVWANRALRGLLGYTLAEYRAARLEDIIHHEDLRRISAETARCFAGEAEEFEVPARLIRRDGEVIPVLLHSAVLREATGRLYGFLAQIVDQRSSQETSARLARQIEYGRVTTELATRFINVPVENIDEAIIEALRIVGGFALVPRAAVFSFEESRGLLVLKYEWQAPGRSPIGDTVPPVPTGMFPWWSGLLAQGKTVVIDDVRLVDGVGHEGRSFLEAFSIGAFLCAPLASDGRRLGLVTFADERPHRWNEEQRALLTVCAELISALVERVQRERRIAETSDLFTRMASSVSQAFWLAELDPPRVVYISPAGGDIFGMPVERMRRDPFSVFERIDPEDRLQFSRLFSSSALRSRRELEYRVRGGDGRVRWLRTRVFPLLGDEKTDPLRVAGTTEDVTDAVLTGKRLELRARIDRAVSELAMNFLNLPAREIPAAAKKALATLATLAEVEEAYLLLIDAESESTKQILLWNRDPAMMTEERRQRFRLEKFPWSNRMVRSGRSVWIRSLDDFPPEARLEYEACVAAGVRSAFAFPMESADGLVGVFGFDSWSEKRDWSDEIIEGFRVGAELLFSAVTRAELERRLDRLRRRHASILDAAGEGVYGLDLDGRTTFVNPAAARMIGWEADELIGRRQHDVLHHHYSDGRSYRAEDCPIYAVLRDGKERQVSGEVFWRKDGTSFPVEYISTPIEEDGRVNGAVVVFRDATMAERAASEQRRRESLLALIGGLASRFISLPPEDTSTVVDSAVERIGTFCGVDHAGLFVLDEGGSRARLAHEWRRTPGPRWTSVMPFIGLDSVPRLRESLSAGEVWQGSAEDIEREGGFAVEQPLLAKLGVGAVAYVPLIGDTDALGWLVLASSDSARRWAAEDIEVLRIACRMFANMFERRRAARRLARLRSFERVVSELARDLVAVREETFDAVVETGLGKLGQSGEFDYAQIFVCEEGTREYAVRYVWARAEMPMMPVGTTLPIDAEPWVAKHLDEGETIVLPALDRVPPEQDALRHRLAEYDVKSLLFVPMRAGPRLIGAIAFVRGEEEGVWSREFVSLTRVVADIYAGAFARRAEELRAQAHRNELAHVLRVGTISELAAEVVHEIRQPLASIVNFVGGCRRLLADRRLSRKELTTALDDIAAEARRVDAVLGSVYRHVRRSAPQLVWAEINGLVQEAVGLVMREFALMGIELQTRVEDDLPPVRVDAVQIQQVLINLVRNAAEALGTRDGPGRVLVATRRAGEREVEVIVEDDGPGVPDDIVSKMFSPFFSTKEGGLGLGLSISRSIVQAHGGTLRLEENRPGRVRVALRLPAHTHMGV